MSLSTGGSIGDNTHQSALRPYFDFLQRQTDHFAAYVVAEPEDAPDGVVTVHHGLARVQSFIVQEIKKLFHLILWLIRVGINGSGDALRIDLYVFHFSSVAFLRPDA